jgi:hypothetical protein
MQPSMGTTAPPNKCERRPTNDYTQLLSGSLSVSFWTLIYTYTARAG